MSQDVFSLIELYYMCNIAHPINPFTSDCAYGQILITNQLLRDLTQVVVPAGFNNLSSHILCNTFIS